MKKLFFFALMAFLFLGVSSCEKAQVAPFGEAADTELEATFKARATVPFHGEYLVDLGEEISPPPQWIVPLYATGKAQHLGKSTWTSTTTLQDVDFSRPLPFDPPLLQVGDMTFTAADGSMLVGSFAGLFDGFGGWGDYEIEYGTGRFVGAHTSADCDCTYFWVNNPDGPNYLEFNGMLVNP